MSSAPPELTRAVKHAATAQTAAAGDAGKGQPDGPVESFAALERTYSITLIRLIDATIAAISRVLKGLDVLTVAVQVRNQWQRITSSEDKEPRLLGQPDIHGSQCMYV